MGNDYEVLWPSDRKSRLIGKDRERLRAGGKRDYRGRDCWWHHRLDGHELGQTPEDGEGQRGLACYGPWGHKVSHTAWQLNNNEKEGLWNLTSISAL